MYSFIFLNSGPISSLKYMQNKSKDLESPVFVKTTERLPLLTDRGRTFLGLKNSSLPVLVIRVKTLFEYLNKFIGFPDTPSGWQSQDCFNMIMCGIYPEVMIDLADLMFLQHERLSVMLNFDHINNHFMKEYTHFLAADTDERSQSPPELGIFSAGAASIHDRRQMTAHAGLGMQKSGLLRSLNSKMGSLFQELANTLKNDPTFYEDPVIIKLLSESYSYYLSQTRNFPWQNPIEPNPGNADQPVIDIATGLAGLTIIYNWPENYPKLVLTDSMPFIIECLNHYKTLLGKKNVEIINADFPARSPQGRKFGLIMSNKFLHHLKRPERKIFLSWAWENLESDGILQILDTDVELRILRGAKDPGFKRNLTAGYLETLIDIEDDFSETLHSDIKQCKFKISQFDTEDYSDETDAYSKNPGLNLLLKFRGLEILAQKVE